MEARKIKDPRDPKKQLVISYWTERTFGYFGKKDLEEKSDKRIRHSYNKEKDRSQHKYL